MARRHRRIVPLENIAWRAVGLQVLRPAGRHFDVHISDHLAVSDSLTTQVSSTLRMVYEILGEGASHGSSSTSGSLTVAASQSPGFQVGYVLAAMTGMGWATAQVAPELEWLGGMVGCAVAWRQVRRWQRLGVPL